MIKLNCDLGEGFGVYKIVDETSIMPYIQMANIACGFHASDPVTAQNTVRLAIKHNVTIGAHPSYPDLVGFGRRTLQCTAEEIEAFILYQCGALDGIVKANGGAIKYVKPHGALYNDMMKNDEIFEAILKAISKYDKNLKLMILSTSKNSHFKQLALLHEVNLLHEVFADRAYTNDGFLVSRALNGAVLSSSDEVLQRVEMLKKEGILLSVDGKKIALEVDSICVHGDNLAAIELIKKLNKNLR